MHFLPLLNEILGYEVEIEFRNGYDDGYEERILQSYDNIANDDDNDMPSPDKLLCLSSIKRKDTQQEVVPLFHEEPEETATMSIYDMDDKSNTLSFIVSSYYSDYVVTINEFAKGINLLFKINNIINNLNFVSIMTLFGKKFGIRNNIETYGIEPALIADGLHIALLDAELLNEIIIYANDDLEYFYTNYQNNFISFDTEFFLID